MTAAAPIVVTALFARDDQAWFDALRSCHYPPERNRVRAHLTMFNHLPPSVADELKRRLAADTRGQPAPAARLAGVVLLGRGVAYRIESPGLAALRARLAESLAGLLTPQDTADWWPHVTVQNKVAPAEAKALHTRLRADFRPCAITIVGLAAWWYRGGPWEPLSRHMFA